MEQVCAGSWEVNRLRLPRLYEELEVFLQVREGSRDRFIFVLRLTRWSWLPAEALLSLSSPAPKLAPAYVPQHSINKTTSPQRAN
jgi:hypothetical protein